LLKLRSIFLAESVAAYRQSPITSNAWAGVIKKSLSWLLKSLNFSTVDIFGAKLGAFSRNDNLSTENFEMLVIAEK